MESVDMSTNVVKMFLVSGFWFGVLGLFFFCQPECFSFLSNFNVFSFIKNHKTKKKKVSKAA